MKKFTLVALAMMASTSCFAQKQILWNGEDAAITNRNDNAGFLTDAKPVLVDNPVKDGINTSDHCLKFVITKDGTDNTAKLSFGDWMQPSMNGSKRISLMIMKEHAENVQVELCNPTDGSTSYWKHSAKWYDGGNKWQKLVFDFTTNGDFDKPGLIAITPQAGNVDGEQIVYIDNIVIEDAPRINGKLFSEYNAENPITGALTLTGAWMKGSSINVDDNWTNNTYDDFAYFNTKATNGVTSIDMRGTVTKDVDINQFFKNPNTIVYADELYNRGNDNDPNYANIVVGGTAKSLDLTDAYAFNAPEDFTASSVKLTRKVQKGFNSFVLPFDVTASELAADKVAKYAGCDKNGDKKAYFNTVTEVAANTPFLTKDAADNTATGVLEFGEKYIVATPKTLGENFVGVYKRTNAKGFYGINGDGKLQMGGADAYVNPFHAYLNVDKQLDAVAFDGSTVTAINGIAADKVADTAVYDLSGRRVYGKLNKGLYIMNGKKVVVK